MIYTHVITRPGIGEPPQRKISPGCLKRRFGERHHAALRAMLHRSITTIYDDRPKEMILAVTHPDINPALIVQPGKLPTWLVSIMPLIDLYSRIDVGHMHLLVDDLNCKAVTRALQRDLPSCRVLRVIRASAASRCGRSIDVVDV